MREGVVFDAIYDAPCGSLGIRMHGDRLAAINILPQPYRGPRPRAPQARTVLEQLERYFRDPRFQFSLPLLAQGSAFQQSVWQALSALAPGTVVSYGALAERLGTGARAVGNACRANPVPIVVPCHRVVGASGPGGYMGDRRRHLQPKLWLLHHEGVELG